MAELFWKIMIGIITGLLAMLGTLIGYIWNQTNKQIKGLLDWKRKLYEKGGVVTRDDHFSFCGQAQAKCNAEIRRELCDLDEWRQDMFEKGGPLTVQSHETICEKVTTRVANIFSEKLDASINHYNALVKKDLELMKKDLEIAMLNVNDTIKLAIKEIRGANGQK